MLREDPNAGAAPIYFNGIDAITGAYVTPSMSAQRIGQYIHDRFRSDELDIGAGLARLRARADPHLGAEPRLNDLASVRWGVVFWEGVGARHRKALNELIRLRNGVVVDWIASDTPRTFLSRQDVRLGDPDYSKFPFYLLLVADPRDVPFSHQYQLTLDYAVGRLWSSEPADIAAYANNVVRIEYQRRTSGNRIAVFASDHDSATAFSSRELIEPTAKSLESALPHSSWSVSRFMGRSATKAQLHNVLFDKALGARLVFSATHGAVFASPNEQIHMQGALVCQDWSPGAPLTREVMFAGSDIDAELTDFAPILFCFACFSAGTPRASGFSFLRHGGDSTLAFSADFLAALPIRLLARGALAMIGHVDLAWSTAFSDKSRPTLFSETLKELALGNRVGNAMRRFATTHAAYATELTEFQDRERPFIAMGQTSDLPRLADLWLNKNDARSYVIVGDPAVRLN